MVDPYYVFGAFSKIFSVSVEQLWEVADAPTSLRCEIPVICFQTKNSVKRGSAVSFTEGAIDNSVLQQAEQH